MFFMSGGADTFNMLVPVGCPLEDEYRTVRTDAALATDGLLPVSSGSSQSCDTFAFHKKFASKNVALVAINVNKVPEDALPAMKKKAREKGFPFLYLFDESQKIAKDYGAFFTPEFFVLNKQRKIIYMGSMDNNPDLKKVSKRYLNDAVEATLAGKKVATDETVPFGCKVRFERKRRKRKKTKKK